MVHFTHLQPIQYPELSSQEAMRDRRDDTIGLYQIVSTDNCRCENPPVLAFLHSWARYLRISFSNRREWQGGRSIRNSTSNSRGHLPREAYLCG